MYERGEREPGFETLEAFADYFNVDLDYLLGKSDFKNKNAWLVSREGEPQNTNILKLNDFTLSQEEKDIILKYRSFPQAYKSRIIELLDDIQRQIEKDKRIDILLKEVQSLTEANTAAYGGKTAHIMLTKEKSDRINELLEKAKEENDDML